MSFNLFGGKNNKNDGFNANEIKDATLKPHNSHKNITNPENNNSNIIQQQAISQTQNLEKNNPEFNNPFANKNSNFQNNTQNPFRNNPQSNQFQDNSQTPQIINEVQNPFENNPTIQNAQLEHNSTNPFEISHSNIENINSENNENLNNNKINLSSLNENLKNEIQNLIDETVEKVIEERWEKLISSVEKVLKWKEKEEKQMILIKNDIVNMSENLEIIEQKILKKVSSYDQNILNVNSEIKALEKVFQKITPTLINNVNELSQIAEDFREFNPKKN